VKAGDEFSFETGHYPILLMHLQGYAKKLS